MQTQLTPTKPQIVAGKPVNAASKAEETKPQEQPKPEEVKPREETTQSRNTATGGADQ